MLSHTTSTDQTRYHMARDTTTNDRQRKGGTPGGSGGSGGGRTALILAAITGAAILAIVGVAIFVASGPGADSYEPNDSGLIRTGAQAPAFTAQSIGGGDVSVGGNGNSRATLLVFFATWCPHCQNEAPIISDIASRNDDLRVVMVGMDEQDNPQKVQEFVQSYGIEGPAVYEPSLGQRYQVSGYPTVYVLDGNGEVVAANSGETPRGVLEDWVELALGSTG